MLQEWTKKISLWGLLIISLGLFFAFLSWPKLMVLSIHGQEYVVEVIETRSHTVRECRSRDLLCDLRFIDRYKTYYYPTVLIAGLTKEVEFNKPVGVGEKLKVVYAKDYIHIFGTNYKNMYWQSFFALILLFIGVYMVRRKIKHVSSANHGA